MLTTLRIKNLALVADLTLELPPGYNAITGETGAGKSVIIGALDLVLGRRADRTLIRSGSDSCSVEAVFDVSSLRAPLPQFLEENGLEPCEDRQLVLKRSFTLSGTNRQFVNGSPTTLQTLADLGEWLVDVHGPHDHQSLLHPARQLDILDAFGDLRPLREQFAGLVRDRALLEQEKRSLIIDEKSYAQQLDLLRFQAGEIAAARLRADEEAALESEHQRVANAARLLHLCQTALEALDGGEGSLLTHAATVGRSVMEIQRIDPQAASLLTLHEQASAMVGELQQAISSYADRLELDPARLQELEERLNLIHSLKRKYGSTLDDVIAFGDEARRKLQLLEARDAELVRLNGAIERLDRKLTELGGELTTQRRKLIPRLAKAVARQLADLGFRQSHFDISLESCNPLEAGRGTGADKAGGPPGPGGFDTVEFQFAPNTGEPPRPLRAIASSGEIARVMLALKTVLAAVDEIPVLVFDEVDANVGGETARAVGEKMRQIATRRQVLCISHLAPVAAAADHHYRVSKEVRDGRTLSEIALLDRRQRIDELARMLGGASDAARNHAESLLAGEPATR